MKKELICVICPNGCELQADVLQEEDGLNVKDVTGNLCEKGPEWVKQEIVNPMRTISSSVLVEGGDFPLASVRTDAPISLKDIFQVMVEIKKIKMKAPVRIGDVVIKNVADLPCNILATRNVEKI